MLKLTLLRSASYNLWANTQVLERCADLPETLLNAENGGSFPSINKTLLHIRNAEAVWHMRLNGKSPQNSGFNSSPPEISALLITMPESSRRLVSFIENCEEQQLHEPLDYRNIAGDAYSNTPEQILFHVFNHSTYHRGQIIAYLRQQGADPVPSTDMIAYFRNKALTR